MTEKNSDRDHKILMHIGMHGLSIRPVIEKRFFDGGNCDNVLQRLQKEKRIVARKNVLLSKRSYYQLTPSEHQRLGLGGKKYTPIRKDGGGLDHRLAVLWSCNMRSPEMHLARKEEVAECMPNFDVDDDDYCILKNPDVKDLAFGPHKLLRIYRANLRAKRKRILHKVSQMQKQLLRDPVLRFRTTNYRFLGFVILVDDATPNFERVRDIRNAVKRSGLMKHSHIVTAHGPSRETLDLTLQQYTKRQDATRKIETPAATPHAEGEEIRSAG